MASPCGVIGTLFLLLALQNSGFLLSLGSKNVYIVYMGERQHGEPELVSESHHQTLSSVFGSKEAAKESILYNYKHGFSGFAAVLTPCQAKLIADSPGVVHVIPNRILNLHTTRSWNFLEVNSHIRNGILSKSQSGIGSIIGIMDTGIWPESESFRDEGMGDAPSRFRGICQEGEKFNRSHCNRKIIGARWYSKGYEAEFGNLSTSDEFEYLSPRDAAGHGTHTSSTAAGDSIETASYKGLAAGLARGGAPSARLAVYKVCWATSGCSSADLLAAFDDAIYDGVDVLSVSLGSPPPLSSYVEDAMAIGSFHAVAKGISVICSAGNSGPYPQTVINSAPWIFTVAASTIDRAFPTVITLGNNQTVVGQALYTGMDRNKYYPLVYGGDIASIDSDEHTAGSCDPGTLNETLASGKVILCFQSRSQRSAIPATTTVTSARGAGLIFAQFPSKDVSLSSGSLPCVQVDFAIGTNLLIYIGATRNPVVKFNPSKTLVGQQISPEVAFFSSRGPNSLSPSILKPDIAAPGVNILASWSPAQSQNQANPDNFKIESGTSMACPHISGIVALLKSIHPTWSPAAIKSALVTTASLEDEYGQIIVAEGAPHKQADPFDYGGGHVDPNKAIAPGLIYDIESSDYIRFLCSMGYNNTAISLVAGAKITCRKSTNFINNLNLPSITIHELKQSTTVSRTVTNVGPVNSIYNARVITPAGVSVRVKPSILSFNSTVKKLEFKARSMTASVAANSPQEKCEVFHSFRGEDTCSAFSSHVHAAIHGKKTKTCMDHSLKGVDEIAPALMKAIKNSYLSAIISQQTMLLLRGVWMNLRIYCNARREIDNLLFPFFTALIRHMYDDIRGHIQMGLLNLKNVLRIVWTRCTSGGMLVLDLTKICLDKRFGMACSSCPLGYSECKVTYLFHSSHSTPL